MYTVYSTTVYSTLTRLHAGDHEAAHVAEPHPLRSQQIRVLGGVVAAQADGHAFDACTLERLGHLVSLYEYGVECWRSQRGGRVLQEGRVL
jgi:hypothetical protein